MFCERSEYIQIWLSFNAVRTAQFLKTIGFMYIVCVFTVYMCEACRLWFE